MSKRDLAWRLAGGLALVGAGGSSLLHRHVLLLHARGPASALELVLGLTSFLLVSLGILLVLRGASLRDGWVRDCVREEEKRTAEPLRRSDPQPDRDRRKAKIADPYALGAGRAAVAMILADRAIRAAALDRKRPDHTHKNAEKAGHIS